MKFTKFDCPYCGGDITADIKHNSTIYCLYCGRQILIDDESKTITINNNINVHKRLETHQRITDDAKIIEARRHFFESNNASFIIYFICIILLFVTLKVSSAWSDTIRQKNIDEGKISAGYYNDYLEKDYREVNATLESAGFSDIELIELKDVGFAVWKKGEVVSVSVGGNLKFNSDDYFEKDTKVVISYH